MTYANAMRKDPLEAGIDALHGGDRARARRYLWMAANRDPESVTAWWLLANVLEDDAERIAALRQVLRLRADHEEARALLRRLERRVAEVREPWTPVVDATEADDGTLVAGAVEDRPASPGDPAEEGRQDTLVVAIVMLVALVAIIGTAALVWSGAAAGFLGIRGPDVQPTVKLLGFGIPACAASQDGETSLVFINTTGVGIDILSGDEADAELLLSLESGEQGRVATRAGAQERYAVSSTVAGVEGSGAWFEVPRGNMCRVPVQ